MVSVHAPSYIPPLTFEPFVLGDGSKSLTTTLSIPSAADDIPCAYSRLRGPRIRRKHWNSPPHLQHLPVPFDADPPAEPQRPALKATSGFALGDSPPLQVSGVTSDDVRTQSEADGAPQWVPPRLRDRAAEDLAVLRITGRLASERRRGGRAQNHVAPSDEEFPATVTGAEFPSIIKRSDSGAVPRSSPRRPSTAPNRAQDGMGTTRPRLLSATTPLVAYNVPDRSVSPLYASEASSRPASHLPPQTVDQLQYLADQLRALHPMLAAEMHRPRVPGPRHGPRPCTPQSGSSSGLTTPRGQSTFTIPRRSSHDMQSIDSHVQEVTFPEGTGRCASVSEDVSTPGCVSWSAPAKGKWKIPWVEEAEGSEELRTDDNIRENTGPLSLNGMEIDESCYTYDPHNAPEFLVGTSTSVMLQATPGFHSRHHPRKRPVRKPRNRFHRPTALVLAPGSQLDHQASEGFTEPTGASTTTAPTPSTVHSLPPPAFDLSSLELLVGPIEPRKRRRPKPDSSQARFLQSSHAGDATATPSWRHSRSEIQLRQVTSRSSTGQGGPRSPTSRPNRKRSTFGFLRRWFRRWMR